MREDSFLSKDMKKTIFKIRLLGRISVSKINSYALLKEYSANKEFVRFFGGEKGIKNEIYNTLNSLEKSNYIKVAQKIEKGRLKNYYTVTKKGTHVLKSAKRVLETNLKVIASILDR